MKNVPPVVLCHADLQLLTVSYEARAYIEAAAERAKRQEVCGFLFGTTGGTTAHAKSAREANNILSSPERFAIGGSDYRAAIQEGEPQSGLLAVYHSHAGSAKPSRHDRLSMRDFPYLWLILGLDQASSPPRFSEWRCFAPSNHSIRPMKISFR